MRKNRRQLQHFDYDTVQQGDNGLVLVEGIFILPSSDPFCVSAASRGIFYGNRQRRGLGSTTATTNDVEDNLSNVASTRANGMVEIVLGQAAAAAAMSNSTSQNEQRGKVRDLQRYHHSNGVTTYGRNGPYSNTRGRRPNVYGSRTYGIGKGKSSWTSRSLGRLLW